MAMTMARKAVIGGGGGGGASHGEKVGDPADRLKYQVDIPVLVRTT